MSSSPPNTASEAPPESGKWRAAQITLLIAAIACTIPGVVLRLMGIHLDPRLAAALFGLAVVGAAFLLAWGAEVAQRDISQALALTILALIAVLPEYAVDAYLAWQAASEPAKYGPLALANMTGANRLLIGVAWPMVVFLYCWRSRKVGKPENEIYIGKEQGIEVTYLTLATLYSFVIPLKGTLSLIDLAVLVTIFILYVRRILKAEKDEEPDLIGPAKLLGNLPTLPRRLTVVALFVVAATVIFLVAEPFAESLIEAGVALGFEERTLVQWLAPLASEAPEFIITGLFAWRLLGRASLGALVSSKVNQWTLLVSTIPLVFNIASWRLGKAVPAVLHLDSVSARTCS
jgi:cation:H+ antiporter